MRQITSAQFRTAVELDPAWASKLTEPVEITDFCSMTNSKVIHLSPLLHFTGKNKNGDCASFWSCKSLKIAEGKFRGQVSFSYSGIEKIGDLTCGKNKNGVSVFFIDCKSLKTAEGKFEGFVCFRGSKIEAIGDLTCRKNNEGIRLNVENCPNLKSIPITFKPEEIEAGPELIKNLAETRAFIRKKRAEIVEIEL